MQKGERFLMKFPKRPEDLPYIEFPHQVSANIIRQHRAENVETAGDTV
jgi:hypothetical protein